MKESMLSHLRAALEIAAAKERQRVHDVLDDFDSKHTKRREMPAPIIRALGELGEDISPELGVEISLAPPGHQISVRFETSVTSGHLVVTTTEDDSRYLISHTNSMPADTTDGHLEYETPESALGSVNIRNWTAHWV